MATTITCNKSSPPLGGLFVAEHVKILRKVPFDIIWTNEAVDDKFRNSNNLSRYIANSFSPELRGTTVTESTEVDHWLSLSLGPLNMKGEFINALNLLDRSLGPVTYLVGKNLTIADFVVFSSLYVSRQWAEQLSNNSAPINVLRWYNFIMAQNSIKNTLDSLTSDVVAALSSEKNRSSVDRSKTGNRAQEGKFVELPGAEMGKVVVRFPPEASGFLHIGHAKAALLNQYYQEAFQGKLIMRFDDTNPAKENVHFEKVILEDVAMLQIKYDMFTHTSQYFDLMLEYCEKLLKEGKAYVDDTDAESMKTQREQKVESVNRSNSVDKNLKLWDEMIGGTEKGQQCCVRAKIDMQSPNGCMRDPTIYRCKNEPHPRTGNKYKVYPTYDFACPIVDSIEGVTHTLRTMEYHDRDPQFYWFIEALGLRKPYIWEYSRLSMTNTVLSKRKLTWFVNEGLVDGWDDPRMPTVRGVLRRGMTVQGLKEFIIAQGSSRSVVFMEWDKIWAFNKKVIDPIAPRYTALEFSKPVPVLVNDAKKECLTVPRHPKNTDIGTKEVWVGPKILIDRIDAECLKEGENTTFINWGNLLIQKINRQNGEIVNVEAKTNLENKDYKKTLKITWLADVEEVSFTPTWCVYFDHIINKSVLGKDEDFKKYIGHETRREVQMLGDPELKNLKAGDIIQLQRRGFFRVDVAYRPVSVNTCKEQAVILFSIPDGHVNDNPLGYATSAKPVPEQKVADKSPTATALPKSALEINAKIVEQGDIVRKLKEQKAVKGDIDVAVKALLSLKADYKNLTNSDWKPGCVPPSEGTGNKVADKSTTATALPKSALEIHAKIVEQGDIVRKLKEQKAVKGDIDVAVKALLSLKADYKNLTNSDWKPGCVPPSEVSNEKIAAQENKVADKHPPAIAVPNSALEINAKIVKQGDIVRKLKEQKAVKGDIDVAVKALLSLKADYKNLTNSDWKPGCVPPSEGSSEKITAQGNRCSGEATMMPQTATTVSPSGDSSDKDNLILQITEQGNTVRDLKTKKASKGDIDEAVKVLLELKVQYKNLTGTDFPVPGRTPSKPKESKATAKNAKPKSVVKEVKPVDVDQSNVKKQTRLGLEAKKEENLSDWYSQVITKGEMIEYYDVSGCYILRPWSFAVWEALSNWFDREIKKLGVENCYFPIFVSKSVLEKEKSHIADFAPEVAWVTRSGDSEMAEPIAVRPTSETVMYPAYAKWIQSYRDLPIKLNQWNNVVRWEFKHPQPFLRTREFLWQEGHTAYALKEEADVEVTTILDLYAKIYTDLLAIPVVKGRKTEKEKFAGGDYTLTVEAFVSASGRAIQGATSHHLGQNFSKMFDIVYEDPETQEKRYIFQNSWGFTTRTIGVMIMVHADNQGLVLPPRVASIQIVIVPCGITAGLADKARENLQSSCDDLERDLKAANVKVKGDYRLNYSPGWKFNHWELKGVPIRIELGPKDIEKNQLVAVRRDTGEKITISRDNAVQKLEQLLDDIQNSLFKKAQNDLESHKVILRDWSQFGPCLDKKNIILAPFCGDSSCEDKIKAESARDEGDNAEPGAPSMGAKSLCIPLEQPEDIKSTDKCIHPACTRKPLYYTLFGRSY